MAILRRRSIKTKLIVLASASSAAAVLLACLGFVFNDIRLLRDAKRRQLRTQAQSLAFNCAATVLLNDRQAAEQLLSSLAAQPTLEFAALYDESGREVASYRNGAMDSVPLTAPTWLGDHFTSDQHLEIVFPVVEKGQPVGLLFLRASLLDVAQQTRDYFYLAAPVLMLSLLAAVFFSVVLQQRLTAPILTLADTAQAITINGDYSLRVSVPSQDEIGTLYTAFNRLLNQVEVSERALLRSQADLENRVGQRTAQLTAEISDRERAQQDLIKACDAAQAANRAKSEFLANMSHEIRTPLNGILGFTDLLRRGTVSDETERASFLETIHHSGQHLLALLNDILDLSKIEAGQLQVESVVCSPFQIVAEVVSVLRARALEKGVSLEYRWEGQVPASVHTDPARLRQVLLNVVGNAVKFTDRGSVRIDARVDATRELLLLEVSDTGIGIPADKLASIFDPFSQADTSVTRRFGGTGLGLAICRRIAEALGGQIEVYSQVGHGSKFQMAFATGPLAGVPRIDGTTADVMVNREPASSTANWNLPPARILVADDGETNRRLIQVILTRAGVIVTGAENGRQAVDLATREPFDLVLMDMQMPVLDGYSATQQLRASGFTHPIIALTAHAMKGDEERCRDAGCSDYLTKPIDPERLVRALGASLREHCPGLFKNQVAEPPFPLAPLTSTLPLDDPEFRDIVRDFIERARQRATELRAAFEIGNWPALLELTHWLKGSGGMAGFAELSALGASLEGAAQDQDIDAFRSRLEALETTLARLVCPIERPHDYLAQVVAG